MTAFGYSPGSDLSPYVGDRPSADVIPIGSRAMAGPALVTLAAAAVASQASDQVLWLEYVTLGGDRSLEWFRAHVDSPGAHPDDAQHAIVVQMFTELFADEDIPLRVF